MVSLSDAATFFAGPGKIQISVVSPTDPTKSHQILHPVTLSDNHRDPEHCERAWLETAKEALDKVAKDDANQGLGEASWTAEGAWEDSDLCLYMVAYDDDKMTWYSLSHPRSDNKPTLEELTSRLPDFLVTGPKGTWPG
eukprot:GHVU01143770.1.p1 GENE.GHVU01143770.1~~GHVU01143770.1.p1  ORF type:complete len:139 (+),score=13.56 GHVU01143770.1:110-526(+)